MSTFSAKSIPVSPMRLITVTLLLLLGTFIPGVPTAQAAGTVTDCTTFGYGPGTLGSALFGGGGTITFACSGTIVVPANGLDLISGPDLVFDATGYNVTLSGNGANRVFYIQNKNVTLRYLTIANGNASVGGGAWVKSGSLTVEHSTFTENSATGGGGVYLESGSLTVEHSTFTGNTATTEGGAILSGGTLIIANSVITGNSTMGDGGGVHTGVNSNDTTINDSTISGNTAGNRGGGIALDSGFATISRSTISGNSAQAQSRPEGGGGVFVGNYMTARIFNSTISGNTSATTGGGLVTEYNAGTTLINSTVTANHANTSGGGIRRVNDGTGASITLDNTIVAGNTASVDGPDMSGQIVSDNYNLIGSTAGATFAPEPNDITGQNALLGPLFANGGPTWTHALLPGSPALDAGDTTLTTDQRGEPRPAGAADDIGAYEAQVGTIVIAKRTVPAGGVDFGFVITDTVGVTTTFALSDTEVITFTNLTPGAYAVTEDPVLGSYLSGLRCDDGASATPSTWDVTARTANIELDPGETVTCTFTNSGNDLIIVEKVTVPAGGVGFDFTTDIPGYPAFTLDDGELQVMELQPGNRTITEVDPGPGYDITGIECLVFDADPNVPPVTVPGNLATGSVDLHLHPGELVFCTFENTERSTITIVKDADPPDGTDFDFALFAASTAITTPFTLDDAVPDDGDPITDTVSFTLPSGNYQVTEFLPSGWALQFIQCEYDGSTVGINYPENRAYIDLEAGDDVICTFNNNNRGTITIVKNADPPDGTDFDFTLFAASTAITTPFTLDDADPDDGDPITDTVSFTLPSGNYQVTELLPNGWALQVIDCDYDGSTVGINYGENRAYIDLAAGDDVICTFNNNNRGTITIVKNADPPDGTDFDFTLFAASTAITTPFTLDDADPDDGDPITDTVSFTLPSGDYTVTELLPGGWALQFIQCEYDGSTVGINYGENRAYIDLAAGDDVVCTFHNNVQTPTAVALGDLAAVDDRPALAWPWLLALVGAALGAALVVWRRRSMAS